MKPTMFLIVLTILYVQNAYSQNTCSICDTLKNNVVAIHTTFTDASDERGFGFVIGESYNKLYIVTAKHVIYDLDGNGLISRDKRPRSVVVTFLSDTSKHYTATFTLAGVRDTSVDITLLEVVKPANYLWKNRFYSEYTERGTPVWFIGKAGSMYIPTGAAIGSINSISTKDEILIDITSIEPGTSGAPLINQSGIVGLIFEDAASGAKAYKIKNVISLIKEIWRYPWQMILNTVPPDLSSGLAKGCTISGKVFNQANNQPLAGVHINFYPYGKTPGEQKSAKVVKTRAAITGPDGSFKADCSGIPESAFPLRIVLWHPDWSAYSHTAEKIERGDDRTDINLYVGVSFLLKRPQ